jgi:hypothetical protein
MAERTIGGLPVRIAILYVLLGLVGLVAYGTLWPNAPVIQGDSPQYMEVARDLRDFRIDEIHDRAPGYPALLVLTGSSETPTRTLFYVSLLLHFGTIWLLGLALRASGGSTRALTAFGLLLMLPPYVELAGYVMTENLAQFALAAGLTGLVMWLKARRAVWLVAASLAIGYAGCTRLAYQLLALTLAAGGVLFPGVVRRLGLTRRDALTEAATLVLGSILIVGGLSVWNLAVFGYFGVAPTFGFHLSTTTTSLFERLPDEYSVVRDILVRERDAQLVKPGGRHDGSQAIWHARDEISKATGLSTPELSAYLVKMNLRLIAQSPLEYLEEVGRSFVTYWFPAVGPLAAKGSSALRWLWGLLHLAVMMVLIMTAGVVFRAMPRRVPDSVYVPAVAYLLSAVIVIYTMLINCFLDIGEPRQRRPTDVLLVFMCFVAAHLWVRLRRTAAASGGTA